MNIVIDYSILLLFYNSSSLFKSYLNVHEINHQQILGEYKSFQSVEESINWENMMIQSFTVFIIILYYIFRVILQISSL